MESAIREDTEDVPSIVGGGKSEEGKQKARGKRMIFNTANEEQLERWRNGEIELWRMDIMVDGEWVTRSMYTRTDVERE